MSPSVRTPRFLLARAARCAIALNVAFVLSPAKAAEVAVYTDAGHPLDHVGVARVVMLDAPAHLEAGLSAQLPADPAQAEVIVRERLAQDGASGQRRLAEAYQGIADAWGLGVSKIPAVVVDHRYVIYGEGDVARAVERIQAYRNTRP